MAKTIKGLESKDVVLNKVKMNIYQKITVTEKKSHIWEYFCEVRDYSNIFQRYLICKNCDSLFFYKYGITGTSTLGRHILICQKREDCKVYVSQKKRKTSKVSIQKQSLETIKSKLLNECMLVCIKDVRPFEIFEGEGMIQFSQALIDIGAKYGNACSKEILPQASVVARHTKEMASNALPNIVETINTLLRKGQHVAISTDSWSDNHRRIFLSITCHFITNNWELKNVTLGCMELIYKKEYIRSGLLDFLLNLGFESSDIDTKFTFVFTKTMGIDIDSTELNEQPCVINIINTILFHTFCDTTYQTSDECGEIYYELHDEEFSDSLQELFNNCINLITFIKTLDHNLQEKIGINLSWNTRYTMIMKFAKEEKKIKTCLHAVNEENRLKDIDFTIIHTISSFLEPFKVIIDVLQGDSSCSIYGVLLFKMKLDSHLSVKFTDSPFLKKLKKRAEVILKEKFSIFLHHKIATFLCPKFKSLQFLSEPEKELTYKLIQQKMTKLVSEEGDRTAKVELNPDRSNLDTSSLLDFEEFSDNSYSHLEEDGIEFYSYLRANIQYEASANHIGGVDLLKFWKCKDKAFPTLAKLAKSILCVPSYSVASENIFELSKCKQIESRNSMNAENLSTILILNTADEASLNI